MLTDQQQRERDASDREEKRICQLQLQHFGHRYCKASLAKIECSKEAIIGISKFLSKKKNFLVYLGGVGIGKTYFMAAMMQPAVQDFQSFRYYKEGDLYRRLRESMSEKGDYLQCLKYLIDDHLLMLDDIGSDGLTEWRKEVLFETIDQRYNSMLPTIITSNYSRHEIATLFHPRVASRLFSEDNIIIENHGGADLRQKGL